MTARRQISIAVISLALAGRDVAAQDATAEVLFRDGNALMTEGRTAEACEAFEASNRIEPRAGTLIRLGECRERRQLLASAWSAYKDALARARDPRKREIAIARAAALEPRLSYLTISVSDESRVDGLTITRNGQALEPVMWNRALPVDGGDYVVAGHAPGHEEWQTTAHVAVEAARVSVEVPKFKELIKLAPPPPVVVHATAEPAPVTGALTGRRKLAIAAGATSVVALATGVVLGLEARSRQGEAHDLCGDPAESCDGASRANDLVRSAHHLGIAANVALGVAGAAAITGGVLWLTGGREHRSLAQIAPTAGPGELGVVAWGRF